MLTCDLSALAKFLVFDLCCLQSRTQSCSACGVELLKGRTMPIRLDQMPSMLTC